MPAHAKRLLHFHLPKTGGTTIRHYLISQLGETKVSPALAGTRLADALIEWDQMIAISGHFSLRQGDVLPTDRHSFTILRDPLDRFLSEFYFAKIDNSSRLLDRRTHALDIDAYLDSLTEKERQQFSLQIEMLYPLGTRSQCVLSQSERVTAALEALEQFDSVAILEELDDFTSMLNASFSWPYKPTPRVNVTSYRLAPDDLPTSQRNHLHSLLEPEIELYQQAREIFRKQRRRLIGSLHCERLPVSRDNDTKANDSQPPPKNFGDLTCAIRSVRIVGAISGSDRVMTGEQLSICMEFEARQSIATLNMGIAIKSDRGLLMYGTNSMLLGEIYSVSTGTYVATFSMLNRMPIGKYYVDAALVPAETHYEGCYNWIEQASSFDVYDTALTTFEGRIFMDAQVELKPMSTSSSYSSAPYITRNRTIRSKARLNAPLEEFDSSITALCSPQSVQSGSEILLPVRLTNDSSSTWPAFGLQPVVLSYRWHGSQGETLVADGLRTQLPEDVKPGQSLAIALYVKVPDVTGQLVLTASLVQEYVAWFMDRKPDAAITFRLDVA